MAGLPPPPGRNIRGPDGYSSVDGADRAVRFPGGGERAVSAEAQGRAAVDHHECVAYTSPIRIRVDLSGSPRDDPPGGAPDRMRPWLGPPGWAGGHAHERRPDDRVRTRR